MLMLETMARFITEAGEVGCTSDNITEHQGCVPFEALRQDLGKLILQTDDLGQGQRFEIQ